MQTENIKLAFKFTAKRLFWISLPVLIWLGLGFFNMIDPNLAKGGNMSLVVGLFGLGMPLSIMLKYDQIGLKFTSDEIVSVILIGCVIASVNVSILTWISRSWRKFRIRQANKAVGGNAQDAGEKDQSSGKLTSERPNKKKPLAKDSSEGSIH